MALSGVAHWIECQPVNRKVAGWIPSQGTRPGCGLSPQLGVCERQLCISLTLILLSISFSLSPPSLKIKSLKNKNKNNVQQQQPPRAVAQPNTKNLEQGKCTFLGFYDNTCPLEAGGDLQNFRELSLITLSLQRSKLNQHSYCLTPLSKKNE